MRLMTFLVAMIVPLFSAGPPRAQPSPEPLGPSILDTGSQVVDVQSFSVPAPEGANYRIGVLIPRGPAPEGGFPVLFTLDGQAVAELLTDEVLRGLDPARLPVVVTLGYDTDRRFAGLERTRDYTPPSPDGRPVTDPRGRPGGGAAAFLDLFGAEVLPRIEALVPIDMRRSTIWGHSYAGLFVLWAAGEPASPFARYVTASPSLWWDYATFLQGVERQVKAGYWPKRRLDVHKGALERERASNPDNPNAQKLVKMRAALPEGALDGMVETFRAAGIPGKFEVFPGLSHGETFRASIRFLLTREDFSTDTR